MDLTRRLRLLGVRAGTLVRTAVVGAPRRTAPLVAREPSPVEMPTLFDDQAD